MAWIHLPFVAGQDQTPDSKIAPLGMLKRIEDGRILFSKPTAEQEGQRIVLVKKPGGTITLRGLECLVNSVATVALISAGGYTFYAVDGGWHG